MLKFGKGTAVGIFNTIIGRQPIRWLRHYWIRLIIGSLPNSCFIGIRTQVMAPWNIFVSKRTVINPDCLLDGRGGLLTIGEDVDIGAYTHIWTLEHDPNHFNHGTKGGKVTINDHVWIASRVTILPGVTIGRGAVVASGSVVTKDVPSSAIVAGIPAREIGVRKNPLQYKIEYYPKWR